MSTARPAAARSASVRDLPPFEMEKRETDRKESRFVRSIGPHCFHGDAGAELLSAVRSFFARARGVETGEIGWGIMANKWRAWSPVGGDWRGRGRRVSRRHRGLFFLHLFFFFNLS